MKSSNNPEKDLNKSASTQINKDFLITQYQALASRQMNHSSIIWNIPTMLFVGQTLLWNIALEINVPIIFRRLIAVVGLLVSIMAYQFLLRNKKKELSDRKQLKSIEKYMLDKYGSEEAIIVFDTLQNRTFLKRGKANFENVPLGKDDDCLCKFFSWMSNLSSFYAANILFITFVIASLVILFYTWFFA